MTLSIGQLNLSLVGDSRGLRKLLPDMNRLGKAINKLGRSQEEGAARALAAQNKQEQAIRRQLKAVQNLNAQIRRGGGSTNLLGGNVTALKAFTREMSKGVLTTTQFNRANDRLNGTLARSSRRFKKFTSTQKSAKIAKMSDALRNLESASVLAVGPLSGLGARIRALGAIAGRSALKMALLFGAITAGFVAMFKLAAGGIAAAKAMQSINARLEVATGSAAQARANFEFVTKVAKSMGLSIKTSADAFSQLSAATRGTSAEGKITRRVFEGLSAAAAALRLSNEQVEGAFRAVQQIASKGRVQSEELIGQLAERIPNAIQIAADAFGVTQAALLDMVQKGLVPASEFLDKFGKQLIKTFGPDAAKNIGSLQGSFNRLSNAVFEFQLKFDKLTDSSGIFATAINALASLIEGLTRNLNKLIAGLAGVSAGFLVLAAPRILAGLLFLTSLIRGLTASVFALNVATLISGKGLKALATVLLAGLAAVAGYAIVLNLLEQIDEKFEDLNNSAKTFNDALTKATADIVGNVSKSLREAENVLAAMTADVTLMNQEIRLFAAQLNLLKQFKPTGIKQIPILLAEAFDQLTAFDKVLTEIAGATRINEILGETLTKSEKLTLEFKEVDALIALANKLYAAQPELLARILRSLEKHKSVIGKNTKAAFEFGDAFSSAFEDAIVKAETLRKVLQGLLQDILRIIVRTLITKPFGDSITRALGGGKAHGGSVAGKVPVLVGEKGPEIFTPERSGTIIPNNQLSRPSGSRFATGGSIAVTQNIFFDVALRDDVRAMIVEAVPMIAQAAEGFTIDNSRRIGPRRTFGL